MANLAVSSLTGGAAPVMGGSSHGGQKSVTRAAAHRAAGNAMPSADPLVPLTPQQITQQATKTVAAAYKPVYSTLNQQGDQIQNIYNKQQQDNQYFQQWLSSKTSALQAQQSQVDQTTNALEQQITGNMINNQATVNQPAGGALAQNLAATNSANEQIVGGAANAGLEMERTAEARLGAGAENAQNFLQAGAQKETTNMQDAMTKLQTTRSAELDKQAADTQKEIARLQGVNINLAENNRNYLTAAQKLNVDIANVNSEMASRAAGTRIAQQNANTAATRANNQAKQDSFDNWVKTQQLSLDQQKFILSQFNSQSQAALRQAQIYKDQHGGALTLSEQNTIYGAIDKTRGEVQSLINQGLTPQQAYHALQNGYYLGSEPFSQTTTKNGKTTNTTGRKSVKITVPRMDNTAYLNAAYNLATQGSLSPGDADYLQKLFGTAQTRYQVHTPAKQTNQGLIGRPGRGNS